MLAKYFQDESKQPAFQSTPQDKLKRFKTLTGFFALGGDQPVIPGGAFIR